MAELSKLWAGHIYGTNTGNLFIELEKAGPEVKGSFRLLDAAFGAVVYSIEGQFADKLTIKGTPVQTQEGVKVGIITAEAILTQEGNLRGKWTSDIGTGGTFTAFPHDVPDTVAKSSDLPEQLFTRTINLGPVYLFAEDVRQLVEFVRQDFLTGRTVVTYNSRGSSVSKYAEDFLKEMPTLERVSYLKLHHQEPEAHGLNRLVTVEFSAFGFNEVRTQGVRESWVLGKAEAIATFLKRYQSSLATTYKKFGLTINQAIFVALLIVMPSIQSTGNRAILAVGVFLLLAVLQQAHAKFIPNASITLGTVRPTWLDRWLPSLLSWLSAIALIVIAGLIYRWLTGQDPPVG